MALLIVSAGALAGRGLHIGPRTAAAALGALVLAALGAGRALGLGVARGISASPADESASLDPASPEDQVVIERIGELSGRLLRLESEAGSLARRVGAEEPGQRGPATRGVTDPDGPTGGPLVEPDTVSRLSQLSDDLDRVEATILSVAEVATARDLDSMALPKRSPIDGGRISSGFGNRSDPFTHHLARHTGLDMPAPWGSPIHASAGGRVRFAGVRSAYGRTVEIDHGNGLVTRYGHASKLYVRAGDVVLPGQRIAAVGSTGRSTGPHLHFEVIRNGTQVEPRLYLARAGGEG
jgi:murein DD-endopeptidase MepM/ murein hydrolase activator NlpD